MALCEICGSEMVQGRARARRTCSAACRQAVHRRRRARELEALRAAAAPPAPTPPTEARLRDAAGEGPGARIRALGAEVAELVESAARRAEQGWDTREIAPGMTPVLPEEFAYALAHRTQKLVAEILASSEPSRNKPVVGAAPVATEGPSPDLDPGTPRNEPVAAAPAREPAAPEVSRNEPAHPRNMSAKKAREFTAGARLVSRDRETHSYDLITGDGTVIGHVEPSYKAGRRSGWTGWAAGVGRASGQQARSTRDEAGVDALGQWIRIVTAKPRRAVTGG